jgi:hypothetical protein
MQQMMEWNIHKDIYEKACGNHNMQWFMKAWPWLKNIHEEYPTDILQLDLARFPLMLDDKGKIKKDLKKINNPFWTPDNPYPINSIAADDGVLEFIDMPKTEQKHIMIQNRADIVQLIKEKNENPESVILVAAQYITSSEPEKALLGKVKQFPVMVMFKIVIGLGKTYVSLV